MKCLGQRVWDEWIDFSYKNLINIHYKPEEKQKTLSSCPGGSNMCFAFIFSWGNMSFDKSRCVSITRQLYVIQGEWYDIVHQQWAQAGISGVPNASDELPLESSHYPFRTSRVLMYRGLTQHCSVRSSIYDTESASKLDTEWSFLKINVKKKATKPYFFETRAMKKHPLLRKGPVFSVFCVISISAFAISLKFPSGQKVVA